MGKIKSFTELIFRLKCLKYDIREFDYVEGKTKDSYLETHPLISRGKRFYENPYLWKIFIDEKLKDMMNFIISRKEFKINNGIIIALLSSKDQAFVDPYIDNLLPLYFEIPSDFKSNEVDNLLVVISQTGNVDRYKKIIELAQQYDIKPCHNDNFAYAGSGFALYNSAKFKDGKLTQFLLDNGIDPTTGDSMSFAMACKEGNYVTALLLANKGANIHTKHDLGLKMIDRNDKLKIELIEEEQEAKKTLLEMYKNDEGITEMK